MAYTPPPIAYGNGKPERAPPPESLSLAEARLSQVGVELRLMLVEAQTSRLEERLSYLEAEAFPYIVSRAVLPLQNTRKISYSIRNEH